MDKRMFLRLSLMGLLSITPSPIAPAEEPTEQRHLEIEDYFALEDLADPRISPDGKWVAYTVTTRELETNRAETRLWMVATSGGDAIPMTAKGCSATQPRWSPDDKYLSFLSARNDEKAQVWVLDRRGGEANPLTEIEQGVEAYEWSPDGRRLVLVIRDPKPGEDEEENDTEKDAETEWPDPWVVDRLQVKRDYEGYLDRRRTHLFVCDVGTKKARPITSGDYDDTEPAWSPDGRVIAFVSNRTEEPDTNYNTDIWLVEPDNPDQGKTLVRVTTHPGTDKSPVWHPSSDRLAYLTTTEWIEPFAQVELALITPGEKEPTILSQDLDRNVAAPRFSTDGERVYFLLEDEGQVHLAAMPVAGGELERSIGGSRRLAAADVGPELVALVSEPTLPGNLFAISPGSQSEPKQLTHHNEKALAGIKLSTPDKVRFSSADGTEVEAFIYKPPAFNPDFRYPTLLWIHGGPQAQYDFGFDFEAQLFAAQGYVVVMPNPRGSTGYGIEFCTAIWRDWGNLDRQDVLAAVDHAIELGYADPTRLGVGGWSYGGILTNYVITSTDRFKGAVSGASGALWVANYGHDQYQRWYEKELGLPWEERDLWERLSPFNKVQNITTPTLWIGGEKDWNVPIQNSEQMYQAMKRLGRETVLVVYPNQHHGINVPKYTKDLYERFLAWYDKYLKPE